MVQSSSQQNIRNDKYEELVLVVPRSALEPALPSNLFTPVESFDLIADLIYKNLTFIKRKDAEINPSFKQIIPYFVFKQKDKFFLMQRSNNAGESRLKNKYSLGIGGHIGKNDVHVNSIQEWGMREFQEEVNYDGPLHFTPLGIINDERDAVGKVHLGLILLIDSTEGSISIRSELKSGSLKTLSEIKIFYDSLESWSQLVFDSLAKKFFVQGALRMHSSLTPEVLTLLEARALGLRIDSARATTASKSGHPTSCFSAADLISVLFFHSMNFDLKNPHNALNDRFIMSKGHAIPVVYAAYKQLGIISDEELLSLRKISSNLEGHPTPRFTYNEAATGSLGQGLSIGVGMALQARMDNLAFKTFVMLGDGEIAEGSVWEAADFAGHNKLDNLIAIVDCNRLGQSSSTIEEHNVDHIAKKFTAFGWHSLTIDGHSIPTIIDAYSEAINHRNQPTVIIAKTFKGYGLESIQDKIGFHGKPFTPEELTSAIGELKKQFNKAAAQLLILNESTKQTITANATDKQYETANPIALQEDPAKENFVLGKNMAPRKGYGYALAALGRHNKNVVAVDADVKNSTFADLFEKEHPERFIQCFIAEQNMVSIATGLISRGKIAFAATFGAFLTRAHDQIRMASIGQVPLRLCGSHCGVSIGEDGPSQMALEDIALMRAIPNSVVLYPGDGVSTYALTNLMSSYTQGISYIRTTRESLPILYPLEEKFSIGGCKILKQSSADKLCIVTAGITLHEALKAYFILEKEGIAVSIIDLYSIKPLDTATVSSVAKKSNNIILTIEDHYIEGGIGEAIRSALPSREFIIESIGVKNLSRSGSPEELLSLAGLNAAKIAHCVRDLVRNY